MEKKMVLKVSKNETCLCWAKQLSDRLFVHVGKLRVRIAPAVAAKFAEKNLSHGRFLSAPNSVYIVNRAEQQNLIAGRYI